MKLGKLKCELEWDVLYEESLNGCKIWTSLVKADASLKSKQFHWKMLQTVIHAEQTTGCVCLSSGLCDVMLNRQEFIDHFLFDCHFAKQIWRKILPQKELYLYNL